jgi:two-component system NtrC family sensor kinase
MRRRIIGGGKPTKARPSKQAISRRGDATKDSRHRSGAAASEAEIARVIRERDEAVEQQKATAEVLRVISSSPEELKPVFSVILENATRLCRANFGALFLSEGDAFRAVAMHNAPSAYVEARRRSFRPDAGTGLDRLLRTKAVVNIADDLAELTPSAPSKFGGARALAVVPMLKENVLIGAMSIFRQEVRPFTAKQIELVQNFAAQAVIAIENTRLLSELRERTNDLTESLEQQKATSKVLEVISRSAFDLQAVFETVVESSVRLCGADRAFIFRFDGEELRLTASHNATTEFKEWVEQHPIQPGRHSGAARAALERRTIHISDVRADPEYTYGAKDAETIRTVLGVPILKGETLLGVLMIYHLEVRPFTGQQIALVETFADQAGIAIENVRLFDDLEARTDDLSESLQQQTATADVLKVISRSTFDLQTVLDTLAKSAAELCEADIAVINQLRGTIYQVTASFGLSQEQLESISDIPIEAGRNTITGRAAQERQIVYVSDIMLDPEFTAKDWYQKVGSRTMLGVPLLRERVPIGVIVLMRRVVRPFTEKQNELLSTFADQAVIAIENARLFDEVKQRTAELSEALERQTATADVLKVISRSAFDLKTVLQTLVESAARLCHADKATITRQIGNQFYRAEAYGFSTEFMNSVSNLPVIPERASATGRALLEGRAVHIPDVHADPDYKFVEALKFGEFRTILGVPMLREGVPIGVFALTRAEVRPFTEKEIELVSTFADQAAIAIENARLFEAEQQRTRELAKSLEDLRTAQDRLVQTEKLASLGQLTAGIAHEIKNPLNFVNNFSAVSAELLDELNEVLASVPADAKVRTAITEVADMLRGNLEKIVEHGKRADSIVKNMLLHSREGSGEHRQVGVNGLVEEALNLAYHGARAEKEGFNITLERSFDPTAGEADLYPQEITRVMLNLISNGFYAAIKHKA